jgi:hypothetical protein
VRLQEGLSCLGGGWVVMRTALIHTFSLHAYLRTNPQDFEIRLQKVFSNESTWFSHSGCLFRSRKASK